LKHSEAQRDLSATAVETKDFGTLYGFENHSGKTYLDAGQQPLGTVIRGNGNNGGDKTEGAQTGNAIGTYLHGPLLPYNPLLADSLLVLALRRKGIELQLQSLDDTLVVKSRRNAAERNY
jgi:CobQ-like glutamine amidotransferase family enzyme